MPIYMVKAGDTNRVKIGLADDIPSRLVTLQTAHYEELVLIREIRGGQQTETWLHKHFATKRLRGEWFDFSPEMLTVEPPAFSEDCSPVALLIDAAGGVTAISKALNLPSSTVGNWRGRASIPARYHWQVIKASNGKITPEQMIAAHAEQDATGEAA